MTSPPDWRRKAAAAPRPAGPGATPSPPSPDTAQDAAGAWAGASSRPELGATALGGWAALEGGDDGSAARAAQFCRHFAWEQPDEVAGVLIGWEDDKPAEPLVRAHASAQPYGEIGAAVAFLARSFEETGDEADLEAAMELHDFVVAMGDGVWQPVNALVGWGAAVLYRATGEEAFLATAERMADVLCETQGADGSWADDALTALAAAALLEMAEAVEARQEVDE